LDSVRLDVNDDTYQVFAQKDKKYLALNSARSKITVFDLEGNREKVVDNKGPGPETYTPIIKLGFGKSTQEIIVADQQKAIIYGPQGYKNVNLSKEEILPLATDARAFFSPEQGFIFSSSCLQYSPEKMEYFDSVQTFTKISPSTNGFRS
jgi:hypothetical protein